jgi:hypothetical protein
VENDDVPAKGQIGSELVRALVVLALIFLSFAHVAPVQAAPSAFALTVTVDAAWCGDAQDDGTLAHAPCHACRLGSAADLPPPLQLPLAVRTVATTQYGPVPVLHLPGEPLGAASARGPPLLV